MTRSSHISTHDDDFFAWTREQAAALRLLLRDLVGTGVDIANVAEEIEDLGKRDLREVASFLARLFEQLMKIHNTAGSLDVPHWRGEARLFQSNASDTFSPGMRRALDLDRIWAKALKRLARNMADAGATLEAPAHCPFVLDDLIDEDFDLDTALAKLAAVQGAP